VLGGGDAGEMVAVVSGAVKLSGCGRGLGPIWARSRPAGLLPFRAARDGGCAAATSRLGSVLRRGRPQVLSSAGPHEVATRPTSGPDGL
jgi:hypothetical protein